MTVHAVTITDQTTNYTAAQQKKPAVNAADANTVGETTDGFDNVLYGLLLSAPLWLTITGAVWIGVRTLG